MKEARKVDVGRDWCGGECMRFREDEVHSLEGKKKGSGKQQLSQEESKVDEISFR